MLNFGSAARAWFEISTCSRVQAELLTPNPINISSSGRKWVLNRYLDCSLMRIHTGTQAKHKSERARDSLRSVRIYRLQEIPWPWGGFMSRITSAWAPASGFVLQREGLLTCIRLFFLLFPPFPPPPPPPAPPASPLLSTPRASPSPSIGLRISIILGSTLRNTERTQPGMVWVIGVR